MGYKEVEVMTFNGTFDSSMIDPNVFFGAMAGSGLTALLLTLGFIAFLVFVAVYIYFALAWKKIAEKRKYKRPWLAWIPIANTAMWLQMGGFHWAWIFLMLIPILGWITIGVLFIISNYRVFKQLKYPGWLSLSLVIDIIPGVSGLGIIAYGVVMWFVAWRKR